MTFNTKKIRSNYIGMINALSLKKKKFQDSGLKTDKKERIKGFYKTVWDRKFGGDLIGVNEKLFHAARALHGSILTF